MIVEDIRGSSANVIDNFPVGMRVLAVDDDPTCLMLLDGLLRKCQYHVTTTSQARIALKMLREDRNRFDLVISDVHMPDMDGFKLLELVGLEMDLPVIMLSANGDPKLVMKGITHGACDYLVKPVRIEELRNIWQHVIRRKKFDSKSRDKSSSQDKDQHGSEGGQGPSLTGSTDQNGKHGRKRKDEDEEDDENGHEDEDPATQKKPRVVWSIELHRKFVAAVNQLGIEKAVPKRILDLMNVEGLTRENVASHLQKYRLYLKRISSVASQQANFVASLGGKDASIMRMGSLDGLGDFRTFTGSGRLLNTALSSYAPSGMLGRLNSSAGVSLCDLTSSAVIQPSHTQNLGNSINSFGKFHPIVSPENQTPNLFQGIPSSLELDQLQQNKSTPLIGDLNPVDASRMLDNCTFADSRIAVGSSSNLLSSSQSNSLMLQGTPQQIQQGLGYTNQSSINVAGLYPESFNMGTSNSSNILEDDRCHESWQNSFQLSKFSSNPLPMTGTFNHDQMAPNSMNYNKSLPSTYIQNAPSHFPSNSTVSIPSEDSRGECQGGLVGNIVSNVNQTPNQRFRQHKQDYTYNSNGAFRTLNSLVPADGVMPPSSRSLDQNNLGYNRRMDISLGGRLNGGASTLLQQGELEKPTMDLKSRSNGNYLLEQAKSQGGFVPQSYDSLDDLMSAVMKREQDGTALTDGEFGFDAYSFGPCI